MNRIEHIRIEHQGLLTIIEDGGRPGFQQYGVPLSGPMDRLSAVAANWLVGNDPGHPLIEMTMLGPVIEFENACQIAITGANMSPQLRDTAVPMYETVEVDAGSTLRFGRATGGCRSYLAIRGTWQEVHHGRLIRDILSGDHINTPRCVLRNGSEFIVHCPDFIEPRRTPATVGMDHKAPEIRILPGPELTAFGDDLMSRLTGHEWLVSSASDRMGYRLEGRPLIDAEVAGMISSPIIPGTIQLSASGNPILLMADAQTIGGYHRIANVISADIDKAGQLRPGHSMHFRMVDHSTATEAWHERRNWLDRYCRAE